MIKPDTLWYLNLIIILTNYFQKTKPVTRAGRCIAWYCHANLISKASSL